MSAAVVSFAGVADEGAGAWSHRTVFHAFFTRYSCARDDMQIPVALKSLAALLGVARSRSEEAPLDRHEQALLNIKFFGYELARSLADALPIREQSTARHIGLRCKPSTQSDLEADWVAHWAGELGIPVLFHRKLWELCYVLQALWEHGCLEKESRGLGFGCGREPISSYLASR